MWRGASYMRGYCHMVRSVSVEGLEYDVYCVLVDGLVASTCLTDVEIISLGIVFFMQYLG